MEEEKKTKKFIFAIIGILVVIVLLVCFAVVANNIKLSNNSITATGETASKISQEYDNINYGSSKDVENSGVVNIIDGGSYNLSGSYEQIIVNTTKDVELNLNNVTITCTNGPAINVLEADTVSIVLTGSNKITATTTEDLDGAIYSKADLVFSGTGSLEVTSNLDGIVSKDTLIIKNGAYTINASDDGIRGKDNVAILDGTFEITAGGDGIKSTNDEDTEKGYIAIDGGTFNITSKNDGIQADGNILINDGKFTITSKDDAIHADGLMEINGGEFTISAAEGIEATYVKINDGTINISASDDGINAGNKSSAYSVTVEINGGDITINMGQGDTDGIDSNGNLYINGGTINITANSPFDYDGTAKYNGGTMIVNGEETTTITSQMMGGGMMKGGMDQGMQGEMNGGKQGRMGQGMR